MKKRFILSLSFMIVGVIIYILFDIKFMTKSNIVFSIIRNFLPDICWTFSFFFISINFAYNISKKALLLNSIYVFGIALLFELLQYFNIARGTFDIVDIFIYSITIIFACFIENKVRRNECEKSL